MEERIARRIRNLATFGELAQFETNAEKLDELTDDMKAAIGTRWTDLGRALIAEKTKLDLTDLSSAEEKIVHAVSEYVGVMKRQGKNATRTLSQLGNLGLIDAAETSVCKATPTQGYKTLKEANLSELSYEQIVLDHPGDFSPRAIWYSRRTLGLPNDHAKPPAKAISPTQVQTERLLLWLRERSQPNGGSLGSFTNADAATILDMPNMQKYGRAFGNIQSRIDFACYVAGLPPLGLTANAPFDRAWDQQDRDWAFPVEAMQAAARAHVWCVGDFDLVLSETKDLPARAATSWINEIVNNENKVRAWAYGLKKSDADVTAISETRLDVDSKRDAEPSDNGRISTQPEEEPYWVFVCNPKIWAIDQHLESKPEYGTWGVYQSDITRFAPGQLGVIRVGNDKRTVAERNGRPKLQAGIYALCEVESKAFEGAGEDDEYWAPGEERKAKRPIVNIRFVRSFHKNPLTIERLRADRPDISQLLLNGFQASSFSIQKNDFQAVMELLGQDLDDLTSPINQTEVTLDKLAEIEKKYRHASPEVKKRVSKNVERGPVGALVKEASGFMCQLCDALGLPSVGFLKKNGVPYVEAHHVMPVSKKEPGSLAASNIMTLCANHHRQVHYGGINIVIAKTTFNIVIDGKAVNIPKLVIPK